MSEKEIIGRIREELFALRDEKSEIQTSDRVISLPVGTEGFLLCFCRT